jgi:hypothetical protein
MEIWLNNKLFFLIFTEITLNQFRTLSPITHNILMESGIKVLLFYALKTFPN